MKKTFSIIGITAVAVAGFAGWLTYYRTDGDKEYI